MKKTTFVCIVGFLQLFSTTAAMSQENCIAGVVYFGDKRAQNARVKLISEKVELVVFSNVNGIYEICAEVGRYQLEVKWQDKLITEAIELRKIQRKDIFVR